MVPHVGTRAGSAALIVARIIMIVAGIVALIIALGILVVVLEANPQNSIVSAIHDAADFLVGPFDGIFTPSNPKVAITVNWGIAIVVYLVVARIVSGLIRRLGARSAATRTRR